MRLMPVGMIGEIARRHPFQPYGASARVRRPAVVGVVLATTSLESKARVVRAALDRFGSGTIAHEMVTNARLPRHQGRSRRSGQRRDERRRSRAAPRCCVRPGRRPTPSAAGKQPAAAPSACPGDDRACTLAMWSS